MGLSLTHRISLVLFAVPVILGQYTLPCGENITLTDTEPTRTITTPYFEAQDPPSGVEFDCLWMVSAPRGKQVEVTYGEIVTNDEHLKIFDHPASTDESYLATILNNEVRADIPPFVSFRGGVTIFYDDLSGGWDNKRGFTLTVSVVDDTPLPQPTSCGGTVDVTDATPVIYIGSPFNNAGSTKYGRVSCYWRFFAPPDRAIEITWRRIEVLNEKVGIYDHPLASPSSTEGLRSEEFTSRVDYEVPPFISSGGGATVYLIGRYERYIGDGFDAEIRLKGTPTEPEPEIVATTDTPVATSTAGNVTVVCDNMSMVVYLQKTTLPNTVEAGNFHFNDDSCLAFDHDENHVMLSTRYDRCQTTMEETESDIIFSNVVKYSHTIPVQDAEITRDMVEIEVDVQCKLKRQQILDRFFNPVSSAIEVSEVGFGNFTLTFDRFTDEQFDTNPEDPEAPILLGDRVFFGVTLTSVPGLTVFIDNCWSTPSPDPLDPKQYSLISRGCPADSTIEMSTDDFGPKFQTFSFQSYTFIGDYSQVFVHCEALVCFERDEDSRCSQGCVSRSRRAPRDPRGQSSTPRIVSRGPLRMADKEQGKVSRSTNGTIALGVGTGLVFIVLGVAAGLIILKICRRP
ncbi:ZP domain-containing protein-like [Diadema antillarum]|uniref:ZP domain-containing protein-like n=1 Tax=Diadema antillarum TaxID=105358 RepID=UPI003A86A485